MMHRLRNDEQGQVLVLALAFLAFVGVLAAVLGSYAVTNLKSTKGLRPVRSTQFAADAAVEGAINRLVQFKPDSTAPCKTEFFTLGTSVNGQAIDVDCAVILPPPDTQTMKVTLTACAASKTTTCGSPGVTPDVVAVVQFKGIVPNITSTVLGWSVTR